MSDALLYLTNRFNLLEVMSARLIEPRSAYGKYYADLLALSDGRIPILAPGTVDDVLTGVISSESTSAFPAIIEVPLEIVGKEKVPALYVGGRAASSVPGSRGPRVWALERPIALPSATTVFFRSQRELEEHRARPYENVPADWILEVRPRAFTARASVGTAAVKWLAGLPARDPASQWPRLGRHAGGLMMLALAFERAGRADAAAGAGSEAGIGLSEIVAFVLEHAERGGENRSFEESLFASAISAIDAFPEDAAPGDILDQFAERARTAAPPAQQGAALLSRSIQYYREVLANDKEFTGFTSPGGSLVLRGLLLFLLRPSAGRLAAYDYGAVGADLGAYAIGMFCVGYAAGRKRLKTDFRPVDRDVRLAKFEADSYALHTRRPVAKPRTKSHKVSTVIVYDPRLASSQVLPDGNVALKIAGRVVPTYEPARDESEVSLFDKEPAP